MSKAIPCLQSNPSKINLDIYPGNKASTKSDINDKVSHVALKKIALGDTKALPSENETPLLWGRLTYRKGDFSDMLQWEFLNGEKIDTPFKETRIPFPDNMMIYEGQVLNKEPHGEGTSFYLNGEQYHGGFCSGRREGEGTLKDKNGSPIYKGEFFKNKRHGEGTEFYPDGSRYEGGFIRDKPHGIGTEFYPDGSRYEGEFMDGKRHGIGTESYPDGSRYKGEFIDGKPRGIGTESYPDGSRYKGEFIDGKRHGIGTELYPDGSQHQRTFIYGKPCGKETEFHPDGSWYQGEFIDGRRHGIGTAFYPDGSQYHGKFINGKPCGKGIATVKKGGTCDDVWTYAAFKHLLKRFECFNSRTIDEPLVEQEISSNFYKEF